MVLAAVIFLTLHVLNGHEVFVAVDEIVSMREGERKGEVFSDKVGCMINTNDGKFISVLEECPTVRDMIRDEIKKLGG